MFSADEVTTDGSCLPQNRPRLVQVCSSVWSKSSTKSRTHPVEFSTSKRSLNVAMILYPGSERISHSHSRFVPYCDG